MKRFRLIFSFALVFLTSSMVHGATQCPGNVVSVQYHSLPHSHIGISAMINGSGPYEFMLDTGAQITVVDPALASELKLEASGSLNVVTVASNVEVPLVSAAVVEVGATGSRDSVCVPLFPRQTGCVRSEHGLCGSHGRPGSSDR